MSLRWTLLAWLAVLAMPAQASTRRPVFEPEDLEMEHAGVIDLDVSAGVGHDGQSNRLVAPDFEFDVGLGWRTELDIDGTYSWVTPGRTLYRPAALAVDNLWVALKHELWTDRDEGVRAERAMTFGLQHGVRVPLVRESAGLGYEALALLGLVAPGRMVVCNFGAFVEPKVVALNARPWGLLAGVAVKQDLDARGRWQFMGSLAATAFGLDGTAEAVAAAGLNRVFGDPVEVYVQGMYGWLAGGQGYGVVVGVSPRLRWLE